jgi:hypothetical protein
MNDKQFDIIVNGKQKTVLSKELTFEEVVHLAFPSAVLNDDQAVYTVTYKRAEGHKPEGELVQGETLKVKDGMIINVTRTDKS